jgi:hypothetical protein
MTPRLRAGRSLFLDFMLSALVAVLAALPLAFGARTLSLSGGAFSSAVGGGYPQERQYTVEQPDADEHADPGESASEPLRGGR